MGQSVAPAAGGDVGDHYRGWVSTTVLRWAAGVLASVASIAGGLQLWAYVATNGPRHLVVGIFAVAVGVSVLVAAIRGPGSGGDPRR